MIESVEGLKNIDEIASVPGVGMIFPGAAADHEHVRGCVDELRLNGKPRCRPA